MASVAIRTGVTSATPASECPPDELADLLWMRRKFCSSVLPRDCRLLLFFIEDGRNSGDFLGFGSEEAYLRDGLGLSDAEAVRWAVDGLRQLNQEVPIAWKEAVEVGSKRDQINARREKVKELDTAGMTQEQIAQELGVSQPTVSCDLLEKPLRNKKTNKPASVRVNARQIYVPLDPDAAAQKLVQKFGLGFMADVSQRITKVFEAD